MERRVLLAVALSVLILLGWSLFVERMYGPPPPPPFATPSGPGQMQPSRAAEPGSPAAQEPVAPSAPAGLRSAPRPQADQPVPVGRDIVVETPLFRAVFTTAGGRLKSFRLRRYRTAVDPKSPPLELIPAGPPEALPLGVVFRAPDPDDPGRVRAVSDARSVFHAEPDHLEVEPGEEATLVLRGSLEGVGIVKTLRIHADRYILGGEVRIDSIPAGYSEFDVQWNLPKPSQQHANGGDVFESFIALQGRKLRRVSFSDLEQGEVLEAPVRWAGYTGKYFLAALVPSTEAVRLWRIERTNLLESMLLLPPATRTLSFEMYLGPKEIGVLREAGHDLHRAIDLGWFTFVALPLLRALQFSHVVTGNYGVDIILLTVLIKLLFYPLTKKSYESMRAMQQLQPQMQRIREEFKDDPQRMNKEVMELYRRHRVNPLGGCLPMLLQMPIFIGLYQALLNAVELRHAPFVWWINDLSAPDRLGSLHIPFVEPPGVPVLTILMGASMLVMQWMTPSSADPTQQRIMLLMPVVFTVMFVNFPSGLTLYWLVNNVLTIGQQYYLLRAQAKGSKQR